MKISTMNEMSRRGSLGKRFSITSRIQSKAAAETNQNDDFLQMSAHESRRSLRTLINDLPGNGVENKVKKPWYIILPKSRIRVSWDTLSA